MKDTIWIGNVHDASNVNLLDALGINVVINCGTTYGRPKNPIHREYHELTIADDPRYPILQNHFKEFFRIIHPHFLKGSRIMVNCQAGCNRSVTLATAYIHKITGVSIPQLMEVISSRRQPVLLNRGFVHQLIQFGRQR